MSDASQTNLISEPIPGIDPKYGGLIRGGDAAKRPQELVAKVKHHPRGRPAMTADVEKKWDAHQAAHRTIKARVVCIPPARKDSGEPFPGYWCAKRYWPKGLTETLVSPHELLELESEDPGVLEVTLLSERKRAYSIPALIGQFTKEARDEADFQEKLMNGELTESEIASMRGETGTITTPIVTINPEQRAQGVSEPPKKK